MIVTCPACATRYAVAAAAIGVEGRRVRCARCQHVWFQVAPLDFTPPSQPVVIPPPATPPPDDGYRGGRLPAIRQPEPPPRNPGARWAFAVLLVIGLIAAAYVGRAEVIALWPPAAGLYDALGVETAPPAEPVPPPM